MKTERRNGNGRVVKGCPYPGERERGGMLPLPWGKGEGWKAAPALAEILLRGRGAFIPSR